MPPTSAGRPPATSTSPTRSRAASSLTIAVVVALSFVLLMLAFRSILIPLTAGLMNLISIGAAFGVVTAVFEKGWGASLVGLDGEVPIVSFVPLMMFAILFGLSMDYEVFLMTHIKEAWERTRDNTQAVIDGVAHTGRVITSAALIMVSVFFAFVINGDPTVKQFGVGMGVAVAVDATLVRCLLVPAVMTLLGRANWWFPRLAGPHRPQLLDRGRGVVPRPRRGGRGAAGRPYPSPCRRSSPTWRSFHAGTPVRLRRSHRSAHRPGRIGPRRGTGVVDAAHRVPLQVRDFRSGPQRPGRAAVRQRRDTDDDPAVSRDQVRRHRGDGGRGQRRRARVRPPRGLGQRQRAARLPHGRSTRRGRGRSASPRRWARALAATDGDRAPDRWSGRVGVATAIDAAGNGVIAWIEGTRSGPATQTVKAATLRPGQAPQVATINTRADMYLSDSRSASTAPAGRRSRGA